MKSWFVRFLIGMMLLGPAALSWGLAVSDVELLSHLNQRLDARIRLLTASQAELDSLVISVSGTDPGQQSFIALKHEIAQDDQGLFIHVTSENSIREPILTLQLELNWSQGRLSREYSLIIDPN
ncbi:MAG: type IV pilus assembly protein FimV [Gammaproteobacteria bacterium]